MDIDNIFIVIYDNSIHINNNNDNNIDNNNINNNNSNSNIDNKINSEFRLGPNRWRLRKWTDESSSSADSKNKTTRDRTNSIDLITLVKLFIVLVSLSQLDRY